MTRCGRFPPMSLILHRQHTFLCRNVFLVGFFFSNQCGINVTALKTMSPSAAGKQKPPKWRFSGFTEQRVCSAAHNVGAGRQCKLVWGLQKSSSVKGTAILWMLTWSRARIRLAKLDFEHLQHELCSLQALFAHQSYTASSKVVIDRWHFGGGNKPRRHIKGRFVRIFCQWIFLSS